MTSPRVDERQGARPVRPEPAGEVELVAWLRPRVAARLESTGAATASPGRWRSAVEASVDEVLDRYGHEALDAGRQPLPMRVENRVRRMLVDSFTGAAGLQALLDDPAVETINVNGADNVWLHLSDGRRVRVGAVAGSDEELAGLLRHLAAREGAQERRFTVDAPELSMQLPGGQRLHALQAVTSRVVASIRRHRLLDASLEDLVAMGTMPPPIRELLAAMVAARRNIVISGGPSVGKTSLLRTLVGTLPPEERLITVEDTFELSVDPQAHPNLVAMQARTANTEQAGEFSLDQCVRAALRLSPDRVIVGEVRGSEVVTMAKAMSIGVDGSLATVHASSSRQALVRLVTYAMEPPTTYPREAAVALIGQAVHFIVHIDRPRGESTRVVASIREVLGDNGDQIVSNEVFRPGADRRAVPATRLSDESLDSLTAVGMDAAVLDGRWWGR